VRIPRSAPAVVVLGLLTGGHAFYRAVVAHSSGLAAIEVSELRAGDNSPDLAIDIVTFSADSSRAPARPTASCHIIVAYEPSCPYSLQAVRSEAARPAAELTLPIMWVTEGPRETGFELRSIVRSSSFVGYGATVFQALRVRAVPAAFLIGADGRVLRTWRYTGDESHDELRLACGESLGSE
jgi:hypothetical protein